MRLKGLKMADLPETNEGLEKSAKKKPKKLTYKQKRFVQEYISNGGNGTAAAGKVYNIGQKHGTDNPINTCNAIACENLSKPIIINEVERRLSSKDVTIDFVLEQQLKDVFESQNEGVRCRTLELLAKYLGMYKEKADQNVLEAVKAIGWGEIKK